MFDTAIEDNLRNEAMLERLRRIKQKQENKVAKVSWPDRHLIGADGKPTPFHQAQNLAWDSERRIVALLGGTQMGKSVFAPFWLKREIDRLGSGDYILATSSFQLFQKKLLPTFLLVFNDILKLGRLWTGSLVFELKNPETGQYLATRSTDPMWGRIILSSAQSGGGLESATAKAAVLDEAGQDEFTISAWKAIIRRLSLARGRILITSTLYNLGWLKSEIIDKAEDGGIANVFETERGAIIDYTDNAKANIALIQADSIINPEFSVEEYKERENNSPPDEFAMQYRGRVGRPRHMIYDCIDENIHFIPRFKIDDEWTRYMGVDFGGINTVATYWAEDPISKHLICYRYYSGSNKTAKEHVKDMLDGEPMRPITYGGAKAEGQWRDEFKDGGLSIKEPKVSDVWIGINKVYGVFKSNQAFIFDDLEKVKYGILNYRRKSDEMGNPTDEIVEKNKWHSNDSIRYLIPSVKRDRKVQIEFA